VLYEKMFDTTDNEAQLVSVIAHEIGHELHNDFMVFWRDYKHDVDYRWPRRRARAIGEARSRCGHDRRAAHVRRGMGSRRDGRAIPALSQIRRYGASRPAGLLLLTSIRSEARRTHR